MFEKSKLRYMDVTINGTKGNGCRKINLTRSTFSYGVVVKSSLSVGLCKPDT